MVDRQLRRRGIRDHEVLRAMGTVPREEFVGQPLSHDAYADHPLPIGDDQTISQPYIVGLMLQAARLRPQSRVLEIGTGSGYVAALLSVITGDVWSVERMPGLAATASERLTRLGYNDAHVVHADGTLGLPGHAPYDAIVVSAAGPLIPPTLRDQLAERARLVMPLELATGWQQLTVSWKVCGEWRVELLGGVRFVRLIGENGWR